MKFIHKISLVLFISASKETFLFKKQQWPPYTFSKPIFTVIVRIYDIYSTIYLNVDLYTIFVIYLIYSMLSARFRYFMLKRTRAVILDSKNSWRCVIAINRARAIHLSPVSSTVPGNRRKSMKKSAEFRDTLQVSCFIWTVNYIGYKLRLLWNQL